MTENQPTYVSFQPAAALTDMYVASMDDRQYRAYWQLVFFLYCNNGWIEFDYEVLAEVCHCSTVLEFNEKVWPKIKRKFQVQGLTTIRAKHLCGKINSRPTPRTRFVTHSRVTKELLRAQKSMQDKRRAGVMSGKVRRTLFKQRCEQTPTALQQSEVTKRKAKIRDSSNSKEPKLSVSDFASWRLKFIPTLEDIIKVHTKSDRSAFVNLTNWLIEEIVQERFTIKIFERVLGHAEASKKHGIKPVAYFFSTLRREIGYQRKLK
ncbi:hypothetical protein LCGC14_0421090 [marine sediment metagenome]|uniref:Uncharacterized protein n=1 Tax=marine sediment metagenome TaxID=412755 RepID=A0A0F9T8U4_9ZZZZ